MLDHFGLWWIVLFLYSPVVHTSVTVLHCPYIETLEEYVSLQYDDSVYPASGCIIIYNTEFT